MEVYPSPPSPHHKFFTRTTLMLESKQKGNENIWKFGFAIHFSLLGYMISEDNLGCIYLTMDVYTYNKHILWIYYKHIENLKYLNMA